MPGGAGPLSLGQEPAVDVPTSKELIDELHRHVTRAELQEIVAELERKAAGFAALLSPDGIGALGDDELARLLRSIFATRRRADGLLGARDGVQLREWIAALLHGDDPLPERFDAFCAAVDLEPEVAAETAAELLHFSAPGRHWLWSRWIWSPRSRTGALPLVLDEDYDLDEAEGPGATYLRVGAAMDAVDRSPEAASFRAAQGDDFAAPFATGSARLGTDVFLVCVYGVYMNTVLGLKMSQEFNAVVPPMPKLARRLLGTHAMEV